MSKRASETSQEPLQDTADQISNTSTKKESESTAALTEPLKTCTKCGVSKPKSEFNKKRNTKDGLQYECRECQNQYRAENKERISEYNKQWRAENKERIAEYDKQYYADNKDKILAQSKHYYADNKDRILEQMKRYHADNKDKISELKKQWAKENPEKVLAKEHRRRARKRKLKGTYTVEEMERLIEQTTHCPSCAKDLSTTEIHRDHVIPTTRKGSTGYISNFMILCSTCNLTKNDKLPSEYAATMPTIRKLLYLNQCSKAFPPSPYKIDVARVTGFIPRQLVASPILHLHMLIFR